MTNEEKIVRLTTLLDKNFILPYPMTRHSTSMLKFLVKRFIKELKTNKTYKYKEIHDNNKYYYYGSLLKSFKYYDYYNETCFRERLTDKFYEEFLKYISSASSYIKQETKEESLSKLRKKQLISKRREEKNKVRYSLNTFDYKIIFPKNIQDYLIKQKTSDKYQITMSYSLWDNLCKIFYTCHKYQKIYKFFDENGKLLIETDGMTKHHWTIWQMLYGIFDVNTNKNNKKNIGIIATHSLLSPDVALSEDNFKIEFLGEN